MTKIASVRNLQRFGLRGPDEVERVTANLHLPNGLGDLGHVAGNTLAARTSCRMMRVLLYRWRMRSILRIRTVAPETKSVPWLAHHSRIFRAVRVVATEAGNAAGVHEACDEIIALHAVLVRGPVGIVREGCFSELVLLQLPELRQIQADMKADRPVIVFTLDRVSQRLALGMTLDARIAGTHIAEAGRIEDGLAHWPVHMLAARSVAFLAADVPFADFFGRDVVIDRMAAVAQRPGRTFEIVRRVQRGPPIGGVRHEVVLPHFVRDIPLGRLWCRSASNFDPTRSDSKYLVQRKN